MALGIWFGLKTVDIVLKKAIDKALLSSIYNRIKRKLKAIYTKKEKIESTLEFSSYLREDVEPSEIDDRVSKLESEISDVGGGRLEIEEILQNRTDEKHKLKIKSESGGVYDVELRFIRSMEPSVDNTVAETVESIGVSIVFDSSFGNLEREIIGLSALLNHLQEAIGTVFDVRKSTNINFVIKPVESKLTLDQWIQKEQFDISLLLRSDSGDRSVEFLGDRAVISSPSDQVDRKTAEYVKEAVRNYYL